MVTELLAPAGSKEAFAAAINAGADAVYLGVPGFNARLNADALNLYDLEVLAGYARGRGKKVFFAMNTLVKHHEMEDAVKTLSRLSAFEPDALILQDTGLARVAREQFPSIPLHASTQLAAHNSYGVKQLAELGFARVILARELSFSELKLIAKAPPAKIEMFCHGALCFCVSGMCLFSSIIGAHSGNRGLCTQPCRRLWERGNKKGYFFSPRDLQLAEHVPELKKIGIASLKIEGRMRSSEYVFNTVKAYRMLLDAPDADFDETLKEAKKLLACDYAREKTTCFFSGAGEPMFFPDQPQCLGRRVGVVARASQGVLSVTCSEELKPGDRLRVTDPSSDRTANFKLGEFTKTETGYDIPLSSENFSAGCVVVKAGDAAWNEKELTKQVDAMYSAHNPLKTSAPAHSNRYTALIARQWLEKKGETAEHLWLRFDDPAWADILPLKDKNTTALLALNRENMHGFLALASGGTSDGTMDPAAIAVELPPFIAQRELPEYRKAVDQFSSLGVTRWVLNNISHFGFFPEGAEEKPEFIAGHFLYTWNAYAARSMKDLGVKLFTASWEDDFLNLTALANSGLRGNLLFYLYGFPPVVRSRLLTKDIHPEGYYLERNILLRLAYEPGMGILVPDKPVMLFNTREKLATLGLRHFGIDLAFLKPAKDVWKDIYAGYTERENTLDSIKFNYKRSVK